MNGKPLSIKTRILAGFALPILLFVGFTFWFFSQLGLVKQSLAQVSGDSAAYALLATAMDKNVVQIQQFLSDVSATREELSGQASQRAHVPLIATAVRRGGTRNFKPY